ncbi:MAG: hypothetical protein CFE45_14185 [Burkholderiales bacterium PBB5]|nr:MAG: hypothetical protein CFE45_14185 [Burkholderiales bacterium PBB5]
MHDAKRFIWPCPCGKRPVLNSAPEVKSRRLPARHQIDCKACGRKGPPGEMPWQAVVGWDRAFPDARLPMANFPLFELRGLSTREARRKLLGVRAELETWRAAVRRLGSTQDVRCDDSDRIDAYLRWTIVAQALAAAHLQHDQSDAARRIANRLAQNALTQEP